MRPRCAAWSHGAWWWQAAGYWFSDSGAWRRRAPLLDDAHGIAGDEGADVLDDVGEISFVVLAADIAEMRRDHDIVHAPERVVEGQRLDVAHVEAGAADAALAERGNQGLFIDDRPPCRVDQEGGRLHQAELLGGNGTARAIAELQVDGNDVRGATQLLLGGIADACLLA